ncbi:MAG: peptide deformylase [Patescibacteria group bacterium]|nr:peptide deformylase [Patescibacteria group bacterium]
MKKNTNGKIMDIVHHPHPILRRPADSVKADKIKSPEFRQFLADMEATMLAKDGAGLAAPQVGTSERIVVIAGKNGDNLILINPQITRRSWGKIIGEEGCLSVIDDRGRIIYGQVERHKHVTCQYIDAQGKKKKIQAEEPLARVIQHELDHLDGILFIDRLVN